MEVAWNHGGEREPDLSDAQHQVRSAPATIGFLPAGQQFLQVRQSRQIRAVGIDDQQAVVQWIEGALEKMHAAAFRTPYAVKMGENLQKRRLRLLRLHLLYGRLHGLDADAAIAPVVHKSPRI